MRSATAGSAVRALTLALLASAAAAATADAQQWRNMTSSRQHWDEQQLAVHVEYVAGRLEIAPGPANLLYQLDLRYDEERFRPLSEYDREAGVLRLGVQARDPDRGTRATRISDESRARLQLNPGVATRLKLEFAAGEADVDLGGMAVEDFHVAVGASRTRLRFDTPNRVDAERLRIESGAAELRASGLGNARAATIEVSGGVGSTELDFGGEWQRDARVSIDMGVGALTLRVPRRVGLQVERSSFLTRFDAAGLERHGGSHRSANWDTAPIKLTVAINAALGAINLVWID